MTMHSKTLTHKININLQAPNVLEIIFYAFKILFLS